MAAPAAPQYQTYKNQVPLSQGQTLGFKAGRGYYARPGQLAQAAAADPYSQLTGYQPLTPAQIRQQAQQEISPLIQAITGQTNSTARQEGGQITALTQDYANELGQMNFASPYQNAEPQQAAVDAALQQSLNGAGTSAAAGLENQLKGLQGSSGAPAVAQAAGALTSQGSSSGNTSLANGSAALSDLIANAAAGGEFGMKLPAVARLSGLQALGENAGAQTQAANQGILQAEGQLPSIIQDLTANNEAGLSNAVAARQKQQVVNIDQWAKAQVAANNAKRTGILGENAQTAAQRVADEAAYHQVEAGLRQEGITAANQRAANAIKAKMAQGARPDPSLSKVYGYIVDANGAPILDAGGKKIPVKSTKSGAGATVPPWGK